MQNCHYFAIASFSVSFYKHIFLSQATGLCEIRSIISRIWHFSSSVMYERGISSYIFLESIENEYIFFFLSVRILFHRAFVQILSLSLSLCVLFFIFLSSYVYIFTLNKAVKRFITLQIYVHMKKFSCMHTYTILSLSIVIVINSKQKNYFHFPYFLRCRGSGALSVTLFNLATLISYNILFFIIRLHLWFFSLHTIPKRKYISLNQALCLYTYQRLDDCL